jgi:hypothetical protein
MRVLDVRVPLPDLWPQEGVAQIVGGEIPQSVTFDDGVHHRAFWELGRWVVRSPVAINEMERLWRRSHRLRDSHHGQ